MIPRQIATPTSAFSEQPERPIEYVCPVPAPDGSVGYDHHLENYFDTSMTPHLLPSKLPTRLYDTIARAHDFPFGAPPDLDDPSWTTPRPLILDPREHRLLARLRANPTDYMGITPNSRGWCPRRSSYEDRRGAVGVTPSEVNTLVPQIPPIDTSLPPPSQEWLDIMAKRILAEAHADLGTSRRNTTYDTTMEHERPLSPDDSMFDYNTDSSVNDTATISRASATPSQRALQAQSKSSPHNIDVGSGTCTDASTDSDIDTNSDDEYDWSTHRPPPAFGDGAKWIIPRKRPSVVTVNGKEIAMGATNANGVNHDTDPSSKRGTCVIPPSSEDKLSAKRQRGKGSRWSKRVIKKPKRYADDAPVRQGGKSIGVLHVSGEDGNSKHASSLPLPARTSSGGNGAATASRPPVSSITATAHQMQQVRIASPRAASPSAASPKVLPQSHSTSVPLRSPKLFPCLLDGCTHVCASAGDLLRHQQSLRHSNPSHNCSACGKSYTRPDALKRHLNSKVSCRKMSSTPVASSAEAEETQTEANREAM